MGTTAERFDLTSGALCLDFANTRESRSDPSTEQLESAGDLVAFAAASGIVGAGEAARLATLADGRAASADALDQALELREAIYAVFAARAAGGETPRAELERLNRAVASAGARRRLEPHGGGFVVAWSGLDRSLTAPLAVVAESALELLTSPDLARVRHCAAGDCDWLFLDQSRNRSRRWCSMRTCGNRSKARRHYRRKRRA